MRLNLSLSETHVLPGAVAICNQAPEGTFAFAPEEKEVGLVGGAVKHIATEMAGEAAVEGLAAGVFYVAVHALELLLHA